MGSAARLVGLKGWSVSLMETWENIRVEISASGGAGVPSSRDVNLVWGAVLLLVSLR